MTSLADGIGKTDLDWFDQLRHLEPTPKRVNFWTPTPWKLKSIGPGSKWYFMLKAPVRKVGGVGIVEAYEVMSISKAWERFGLGNGVASFDELKERTRKYAERRSGQQLRDDYEIGCIILRNAEFWGEQDYLDPDGDLGTPMPDQVVTFKYVAGEAPMGDWSYAEIRATVDAYLRLRAAESSGRPLVKAEVNRELRESALKGRTKGSVEFRMQNISAILDDLGLQWVQGYKPAVNVGPGPTELIRRALREQASIAAEVSSGTTDEAVLSARASMLKGGHGQQPRGNHTPRRVSGTSTSFERSPSVVRFVLDAANGVCDLCGLPAPFLRGDGEPFLEVHHVLPLGDGGPDTVENAVALCPNCHRKCHHAKDASATPSQLRGRVSRLSD
ncbi:MAG: HNH endonuclease signature motif containing protein [Gemmatimonadetes bacterium]|nr:HNH endonuclease signature motif containing protein [Gemmatimonadota bacterium]